MDIGERIAQVQAEHPGVRIDCYMTFPGHFDALALHDAAIVHGIDARISTTPRAIQSSCGVALLVDCPDVAALVELAHAEGLAFEQVVPLPCQIDPHRDRYC